MIEYFPFERYDGEGEFEQILTPISQSKYNTDPDYIYSLPTTLVTTGDYIVTQPDGSKIVLSPKEFNNVFTVSSLHPFIAKSK